MEEQSKVEVKKNEKRKTKESKYMSMKKVQRTIEQLHSQLAQVSQDYQAAYIVASKPLSDLMKAHSMQVQTLSALVGQLTSLVHAKDADCAVKKAS